MPPRAKISSPSTVGVALGPALQLFPFHWKSGPTRVAQTCATD